MDGVEQITQLEDTHVHWVAEFGGSRHEWDAEITEQKPDERVAWRHTDGKDNAGVVTFHRVDDDRTRVMVQMNFVPEGVKEKPRQGDLERFRELIEQRGGETARGAARSSARPRARDGGATVTAHRLVIGYASLRIAYALGLLAAPGRTARPWLGGRDLLLAAGALAAPASGGSARPWLAAWAGSDTVDLAATLIADGGGLPARSKLGTTIAAGTFGAAGAALEAARRS